MALKPKISIAYNKGNPFSTNATMVLNATAVVNFPVGNFFNPSNNVPNPGSSGMTVGDGTVFILPYPGTISRLLLIAASELSDTECPFTVYKNGSATVLTTSISADHTTGSDYSHHFTVAAGDMISFKHTAAAGNCGRRIQMACLYQPS